MRSSPVVPPVAEPVVGAGVPAAVPCPNCEAARETNGWHAMFNPLCVWCGARLVQRLQAMGSTIGARAVFARQSDVRRVWAGYGVDLAELDALCTQQALAMKPRAPARRGKASAGS